MPNPPSRQNSIPEVWLQAADEIAGHIHSCRLTADQKQETARIIWKSNRRCLNLCSAVEVAEKHLEEAERKSGSHHAHGAWDAVLEARARLREALQAETREVSNASSKQDLTPQVWLNVAGEIATLLHPCKINPFERQDVAVIIWKSNLRCQHLYTVVEAAERALDEAERMNRSHQTPEPWKMVLEIRAGLHEARLAELKESPA